MLAFKDVTSHVAGFQDTYVVDKVDFRNDESVVTPGERVSFSFEDHDFDATVRREFSFGDRQYLLIDVMEVA